MSIEVMWMDMVRDWVYFSPLYMEEQKLQLMVDILHHLFSKLLYGRFQLPTSTGEFFFRISAPSVGITDGIRDLPW